MNSSKQGDVLFFFEKNEAPRKGALGNRSSSGGFLICKTFRTHICIMNLTEGCDLQMLCH